MLSDIPKYIFLGTHDIFHTHKILVFFNIKGNVKIWILLLQNYFLKKIIY